LEAGRALTLHNKLQKWRVIFQGRFVPEVDAVISVNRKRILMESMEERI
jgi:hypothetical protein